MSVDTDVKQVRPSRVEPDSADGGSDTAKVLRYPRANVIRARVARRIGRPDILLQSDTDFAE